MAGKPQKRPEDLVFRRPSRAVRRTVALDLDDLTLDVPPFPAGLNAHAQTRWVEFWRSPVSTVATPGSHGEAITHWARLVSRRYDLWAQFVADGPTITGAGGTQIVNPAWRIVRELDAEIAHYEEQFGMTPLAQMRLGVEFFTGKNLQADLVRKTRATPVRVEDLPQSER